jgi:PAS domain S-box-containing protein
MDPASMIRTSPIAAVISNPRLPDNPIIECNKAFLDLTGFDREEIIGRNCRFLAGAGTEPQLTEALRSGIRNRQPVLVEILNYKKDGTPFRNAVMIAPIFDAAGDIEYFLGSQVEVAEEAAQAKESRRMCKAWQN